MAEANPPQPAAALTLDPHALDDSSTATSPSLASSPVSSPPPAAAAGPDQHLTVTPVGDARQTLASMRRIRELRETRRASSPNLMGALQDSGGAAGRPTSLRRPPPASSRRSSRFVLDGPVFEVRGRAPSGSGSSSDDPSLVMPPTANGGGGGGAGADAAPPRGVLAGRRSAPSTAGRRGRRTTVQLMSYTKARMGGGSLLSSVRRVSGVQPSGGTSPNAGRLSSRPQSQSVSDRRRAPPSPDREQLSHSRSRSWSDMNDIKNSSQVDMLGADGAFFLNSSLQVECGAVAGGVSVGLCAVM